MSLIEEVKKKREFSGLPDSIRRESSNGYSNQKERPQEKESRQAAPLDTDQQPMHEVSGAILQRL